MNVSHAMLDRLQDRSSVNMISAEEHNHVYIYICIEGIYTLFCRPYKSCEWGLRHNPRLRGDGAPEHFPQTLVICSRVCETIGLECLYFSQLIPTPFPLHIKPFQNSLKERFSIGFFQNRTLTLTLTLTRMKFV